MPLTQRVSRAVFKMLHGRHLVYNQCWEDPRLDREALQLTDQDRVMVITSAGCNVLDYALCGPAHIHAVDVNPRQNALLALKLAGIRHLDYENFFQLFGRGRHPQFVELYKSVLRPDLPKFAREFWDSHQSYFTGSKPSRSFFYRGTAGRFARLIRYYTRATGTEKAVDEILDAPDLETQHRIYHERIKPKFWSRPLRWAMDRDTTLSLLGVPRAQKEQILRHFPRGVNEFVEQCIEAVFANLPLSDNYFWRVYLRGEYTPTCCPEYLKPESFAALKGGLADRISIHTDTIEDFLADGGDDLKISRFILLDHMDWLAGQPGGALQREWRWTIRRSTPDARYLFRSGALEVDYVDSLEVEWNQETVKLGSLLAYDQELAGRLHKLDRVHTYGSFYIGRLKA
jgi:S-adenosylmethionine-diacylglycerol 3-amino-3-carboxypropyl transferase